MTEKSKGKNLRLFLLFAGPAVALFLLVVVLPFLYGLCLTFTDWDGISANPGFVGLSNYIATFQDTGFWNSLLLTLQYVLFSVIFINLIAFLLAYFLTSGFRLFYA